MCRLIIILIVLEVDGMHTSAAGNVSHALCWCDVILHRAAHIPIILRMLTLCESDAAEATPLGQYQAQQWRMISLAGWYSCGQAALDVCTAILLVVGAATIQEAVPQAGLDGTGPWCPAGLWSLWMRTRRLKCMPIM